VTFLGDVHATVSASEMTYIVSGGALNSILTQLSLTDWSTHTRLIVPNSSTVNMFCRNTLPDWLHFEWADKKTTLLSS